MSAQRCGWCGRFCADGNWAYVFHGDGDDEGEVVECRACMSPVDEEAFFGKEKSHDGKA